MGLQREATIGEVLARVDAVDLPKEVWSWTTAPSTAQPKSSGRTRVGSATSMTPGRTSGSAAIRAGLTHVGGDVVMTQDADLELDPSEYELLVAPIRRGAPLLSMGRGSAGRTVSRVAPGLRTVCWSL